MLVLPAISNFASTETVNFGIACDVGPSSILYFAETAVTPN
jgi:hypothetical protein